MTTRRKNNGFVKTIKASDYRAVHKRLDDMGYAVLLPMSQTAAVGGKNNDWDKVADNAIKESSCKSFVSTPNAFMPIGNEVLSGVTDIGSPQLGYMSWGNMNDTPNRIAYACGLMPYTAAGIEFNKNMMAARGPQPMYDLVQYVGGNVVHKTIRYQDAGAWIRGQIIDRQRELLNLQAKNDDVVEVVGSMMPSNPNPTPYAALCESIRQEIARLQGDLKEWERTEPEVRKFIEDNNLAYTWLALVTDQVMFGISFPELQLNLHDLDGNLREKPTSQWSPKIIGLGYRPCLQSRLERKDEHGRINFTYHNAVWAEPYTDETKTKENEDGNRMPIAIPAIDFRSPLPSLRDKVNDAKLRNVPLSERPTRFTMPTINKSADRDYYPLLPWHSIYGFKIFEYLSTIFSDRYTRKKHSNIIGRVIYVNNEYLNSLFLQSNATTAEERNAVRTQLYESINTWLANPDNAGQSLLAFSFTGADGKERKNFEIVELESGDKNAVAANEKETAEISSVVFMAMGLDARILGSTPLSLIGSSGGTDLRERFLLRQILRSPEQTLMLKTFDVISRFNEWDSHLVWRVGREVMTTLDRSKSGISEDVDNEQ